MFKIDSQSKKQNSIGLIKKEKASPKEDLTTIIGYHTMNCYDSEKNETVSELFKLTNVSKNQMLKFS